MGNLEDADVEILRQGDQMQCFVRIPPLFRCGGSHGEGAFWDATEPQFRGAAGIVGEIGSRGGWGDCARIQVYHEIERRGLLHLRRDGYGELRGVSLGPVVGGIPDDVVWAAGRQQLPARPVSCEGGHGNGLVPIVVESLEGDGHDGVWSVTLQGIGDVHKSVPGCAGRRGQVGDAGGLRRKKSKT